MASLHAQRAAYRVVCAIGYWVVLCAGLGVYLSLLMSETSLSIILTVCVLRLHHAAPGHAAMSPLTASTSPGQVSHHLDRLLPGKAAMSPLTASTSPGQVSHHLDRLLPGHAAMSPLTRRLVLQWMAGVVGASVTSRGAARSRDTTPAHKLTRLSPGQTTHYQSCTLVRHFLPRFIIFECHTHYRLYNVTTRGLKVIKTMLIKNRV